MDVEFKLFGSLTVRQAGFIAAGGFAALIFYFMPIMGFIKWMLIILSVVFGLSLALIRINDQPFEIWVINFIYALFASQRRIWKKSSKVPEILSDTKVTRGLKSGYNIDTLYKSPSYDTVQLPSSELGQRRVQVEKPLDIKSSALPTKTKVTEKLDMKLASSVPGTSHVDSNLAKNSSSGSTSSTNNLGTGDVQKPNVVNSQSVIAPLQPANTTSQGSNVNNSLTISNINTVSPAPNTVMPQNVNVNSDNKTLNKPHSNSSIGSYFAEKNSSIAGPKNAFADDLYNVSADTNNSVVVKGLSNQNIRPISNSTKPQVDINKEAEFEEFTVPLNSVENVKQQNTVSDNVVKSGPVLSSNLNTPGISAGVAGTFQPNQISAPASTNNTSSVPVSNLTNVPVSVSTSTSAPNLNGLSVVKNSTSGTITGPDKPSDVVQNKATIFDDIIPSPSQTSQLSNVQSVQDLNQSPSQQQVSTNTQVVDENKQLREKVAEISENFSSVKAEISKYNNLMQQKEKENSDLRNTIIGLQNDLERMKVENQKSFEQKTQRLQEINPVPNQKFKQEVQSGQLKVYQGPSLNKRPNDVSCIVKDKNGKLLPGVVVIIKTSGPDARPVRVNQTNPLGQFRTVSTIEENGTYILELSKDSVVLGTYEIELNGQVLPTYEFIV